MGGKRSEAEAHGETGRRPAWRVGGLALRALVNPASQVGRAQSWRRQWREAQPGPAGGREWLGLLCGLKQGSGWAPGFGSLKDVGRGFQARSPQGP